MAAIGERDVLRPVELTLRVVVDVDAHAVGDKTRGAQGKLEVELRRDLRRAAEREAVDLVGEAAVVRRALALELQPAEQVDRERGILLLASASRGARSRAQLAPCQGSAPGRRVRGQKPEAKDQGRCATMVPAAWTFDYCGTAPNEDTWVRRRPLNETDSRRPAMNRAARSRASKHSGSDSTGGTGKSIYSTGLRLWPESPALRQERRRASSLGPPASPKIEREDNPPIRAARARGAAGFCPHGAHLAAPAELHREADRPAGRERAVRRGDRHVFRAVDPLHRRHDHPDVGPGGHALRLQPARVRK